MDDKIKRYDNIHDHILHGYPPDYKAALRQYKISVNKFDLQSNYSSPVAKPQLFHHQKAPSGRHLPSKMET